MPRTRKPAGTHAASKRAARKTGPTEPTSKASSAKAASAKSKSTAKPARAAGTPGRGKVSSSREKVRAHRARMRGKGLRLFQMWLPDTSTPEYREQAHKASLAIANSPTEAEDQAFIDSVSWWNSEEAAELDKLELSPEEWWGEGKKR